MQIEIVESTGANSNHFVKEFGILDLAIQNEITRLINSDGEKTFETSRLYSTAEETLLVDHDIRSSQYKTFSDKKLFDLADSLIIELNKRDLNNDYLLVKNNITLIKYEKGDFFKSHEDFLSIQSNSIEEYTLLM